MRRFAATLVVVCACSARAPTRPAADAGPGVDAAPARHLTVVTLNTHSFQEGPDSLEKLGALGAGLGALDADIVGLQEVMSGAFWSYDYGGAEYDGTAIIRQSPEDATAVPWYAVTVGFAHWDTGEQMANVILSRSPLVETDAASLTTTDFWPAPDEHRNVVYARTEVPGFGPVAAFVTHPWGWDSADTTTQIAEVKAFVASHERGDESLTVVLGDLNMPSTWPAYTDWISAPPSWVDAYAAANPDGFTDPTTLDGPDRIDYILAGPEASIRRAFRTFDGESAPIVSDHLGVVAEFRQAD